ncbi:MAG: NADH-quinone oxidoreductase subunit N [Chloroflexota bacterium]|nr:NADH-quinone oxidoreductase subunit N [Dehalococcoidia bacterium]MDW8047260.1 NADH-quinone oxidoreductase subunit N [Chloroflexota bacterium]
MKSLDIVGPQLALLVAAGLILVIDALWPKGRRWLPFVALGGAVLSAMYTTSWVARDEYPEWFAGTYVLDRYAVFFQYVFAGIAALVVLASIDWVRSARRSESEYYALLLVVTAGLMFLAGARDLITIFVALELSSIPQYVLAGWGKDERSSEAGLKYLLTGAIASAALLYGMVLLFGFTGTTQLSSIAETLRSIGNDDRPLLVASMLMIAAGFGFKMAVVPFQMWVPDVYQGAPTPVAAFLSVGSKAAGFAVAMRVFFEAFRADALVDDWSLIFAAIAAASMTLGNVMALVQSDIKRMLGYSSIAQAGNFLVGVAAVSAAGGEFTLGASAVLLFVAAYAFTNLGAFIAVIAISQRIGSDRIADYAGMWRRSPALALALAFCLVSLTGIPPTAGFWAKLYVFNAAVRADLVWLVAIGVVNTAVSAFYYLGVVRQMFLGDAEGRVALRPAPGAAVALAVAVAGVLVLGILPTPVISAARDAVEVFARQ